MTNREVVSHKEWVEARQALLQREKEFTRLRDELAAARRQLPWESVEREYIFDGPSGRESLADLFGAADQLIVYHFMFDPDWDEGCVACSFMADHFNPATIHVEQRNAAFVAISRAPLDKLQAYRERMGWSFKWLSSSESTFNFDYQVSFPAEAVDVGQREYNYASQNQFDGAEAPGLSVFTKIESGEIFHTYSTYARGLEDFLGTYRFLDVLPSGRDEDDLAWPMAWLQRHDQYDADVIGIEGIE
ncbi:MAG: thioredoxin family protein [Chloroflexi bacterium]|nr:thioredoxin family protein [Chloroflexota bacterium]